MNKPTVIGFGGGTCVRLTVLLVCVILAAWLTSACGGSGSNALTPVETPPTTLADNTAVVSEVLAAPVPEGVDPALWETLTQKLARELAARNASEYRVTYPWGILTISSKWQDGQSYLVWDNSFLHWDGSGDGVVGVSDITPLAQHFGEWVNDVPAAGVADYNWDGKVGIADITPLAVHFGEKCAGFVIQESAVCRGASYADVASISYTDTSGVDDHGYGVYMVPVNFTDTVPLWVRVVALDEAGHEIARDPKLWRGYTCEGSTPRFPVDDLEVVSISPPVLTWTTHFFEADGDQNGRVTIADVTPPAAVIDTYGEGCSVEEVPCAARADYDRSGYVELMDCEVLVDTFNQCVNGFQIEVSVSSPDDGYIEDGLILYVDRVGVTEGGFNRYEYTINSPPAGMPYWVRVTPYDWSDEMGVPCAPVYFPAS